jgi:hypothetical protein
LRAHSTTNFLPKFVFLSFGKPWRKLFSLLLDFYVYRYNIIVYCNNRYIRGKRKLGTALVKYRKKKENGFPFVISSWMWTPSTTLSFFLSLSLFSVWPPQLYIPTKHHQALLFNTHDIPFFLYYKSTKWFVLFPELHLSLYHPCHEL